MKLKQFDGFKFREKGIVVKCIITPIIMETRIKTKHYKMSNKCKLTESELKRRIINDYIKDFINLNFNNEFSNIKLYRHIISSEDKIPIDKVSKIDIKELMINLSISSNKINFEDERYNAAIDPFLIDALNRSFLIETTDFNNNKSIYYNKNIKNNYYLNSMINILNNVDVTSIEQLITVLYTYGKINCSLTAELDNDKIILDYGEK